MVVGFLMISVPPCVLQRHVPCAPFLHGWWGDWRQCLKVPLEGVHKNGVSNFRRSIGHFFFLFARNCWGPVTSANKCVWAPRPCIMRSFLGAQNATETQARKRHININFFVRLVLGRPRVCPGDFTGFVPGTNPVQTRDRPGGFLLILHSGSPI